MGCGSSKTKAASQVVEDCQQKVPESAATTGTVFVALPTVAGLIQPDISVHIHKPLTSETVISDDSVYFVSIMDISGFTKLTERFSGAPEQLTRVVNSMFEPMLANIKAHGGYVDRFAGDALICIFPTAEGAVSSTHYLSATFNGKDSSAGTALSLHSAVDCGTLTFVYCGGADNKWMRLTCGSVFANLESLLAVSRTGETVVSASVWSAVQQIPGYAAAPVRSDETKFVVQNVPTQAGSPPASNSPIAVRLDVLQQFVDPFVVGHVEKGIERFLTSVRCICTLFIKLNPNLTNDPRSLAGHLSTVQHATYKYGGFIANLLNDEKGIIIVTVFGFPTTHTDDSTRSCKAALEIRDKIGADVTIGAARGQSFCGFVGSEVRRDVTVLGFSVVTAARLMQITGPGSISCLSSVVESAKDGMTFDVLQPFCVKGHAREIAVARLLSSGSAIRKDSAETAGCRLRSCLSMFFEAEMRLLALKLSPEGKDAVIVLSSPDPVCAVTVLSEASRQLSCNLLVHRCAEYETQVPYSCLKDGFSQCISQEFSQSTSVQKWEILSSIVDPSEVPLVKILLRSVFGCDNEELHPSGTQESGNSSLGLDMLSEKRKIQLLARLWISILSSLQQQQLHSMSASNSHDPSAFVIVLTQAEFLDSWSRSLLAGCIACGCSHVLKFVLVSDSLDVPFVSSSNSVYLRNASSESDLQLFLRCAFLETTEIAAEIVSLLFGKAQGVLVSSFHLVQWMLLSRLATFSDAANRSLVPNVEYSILEEALRNHVMESAEKDSASLVDALSPELALTAKIAALCSWDAFTLDELIFVFPEDSLKPELSNLLDMLCSRGILTDTSMSDSTFRFCNLESKKYAASLLSSAESLKIHRQIACLWEQNRGLLSDLEASHRCGYHWFLALPSISDTNMYSSSEIAEIAQNSYVALAHEAFLLVNKGDYARACSPFDRLMKLIQRFGAKELSNVQAPPSFPEERHAVSPAAVCVLYARCLNMLMRKEDAVRAVEVLSFARGIVDECLSSDSLPSDVMASYRSLQYDTAYGMWLASYRHVIDIPGFTSLDVAAENVLSFAVHPVEKIHALLACALSYYKLGKTSQVVENVERALEIYKLHSAELEEQEDQMTRFSSTDPMVQLMLLCSRLQWARSAFSEFSRMQADAIKRCLEEVRVLELNSNSNSRVEMNHDSKFVGASTHFALLLATTNMALACHNAALEHNVQQVYDLSYKTTTELLRKCPAHLSQLFLQMQAFLSWSQFANNRDPVHLESMIDFLGRVQNPDNILRTLAVESMLGCSSADATLESVNRVFPPERRSMLCQSLIQEAVESCENSQRDLLPEALRLQAKVEANNGQSLDFKTEQRIEEVCYRAVYLASSEEALSYEIRSLIQLEKLWISKKRNAKLGLQLLNQLLAKVREENADTREARALALTLEDLSKQDTKSYGTISEQVGEALVSIVRQLAEAKGVPETALVEKLQQIVEEHESLRCDIERNVLKTGDRIPLFNAVSMTGKHISMQDLLSSGPVVMTFLRGSWCPGCNVNMRVLVDQMPVIQGYGATMLFITSCGGSDFYDWYHPNCSLVEDKGFGISSQFNLVYECPPKTRDIYTFAGMRPDIAHGTEGDWRLPVTATYIVNQQGVIVDGHWHANGMYRMSVDQILVSLRSMYEERQRKLALQASSAFLESVDF
eukprot:ANDGO_02062.mRNA.1 guanylyl cyclase